MEGLLKRWTTKNQAKFMFQRNRAVAAAKAGKMDSAVNAQVEEDVDFLEMDEEDTTYKNAVQRLTASLDFGCPVLPIDRRFLPSIDFEFCAAVVVVGQDGLVANTAKYVGDTPIVAVNPDPQRIDGVLLPYSLNNAHGAIARVLEGKFYRREITLAEAELQDGQRLLAFNDFFVGASSHVSARYELHSGNRSEEQSSSGILVSTGAGSTGWMSSLYNMLQGMSAERRVAATEIQPPKLAWSDERLIWAVREPFRSRTSGISMVRGQIDTGEELTIESRMPNGGVIFSDGIESDYLEFNGGTIAKIRVAKQRANLVVPTLEI